MSWRRPSRAPLPPPSGGAAEGEVVSIQHLRAVAALMVLVYHASRWAWPRFDVGSAGVDVFFVISGFILWTISAGRETSPLEFLRRRWVRVAPLYWLLTLAAAVGALAWPAVIYDVKPTWPHLIQSLLFIPHLNPDGLPFPMVVVGWTLNYEAAFYVLFAAALLAPARARIWVLSGALAAVGLFGFFVFQPAYFLGANFMLLQFAAGVWLAEARLQGRLPGRRNGAAMAAMGAAIFGLLYVTGFYNGLWRPLLWGVPAWLLVAGLVSVEADGGMRRIGWLHGLGAASYSLYLTHYLVIEGLAGLVYASRWWFPALAVAASLATGLACHRWLERPLLSLFRRRPVLLPSRAI